MISNGAVSNPTGLYAELAKAFTLTAQIADMVDHIIDNAFVTFHGSNYQQKQDLPIRTPCALQLADLYCAYYELMYMAGPVNKCQNLAPEIRDSTPHTKAHLCRGVVVCIICTIKTIAAATRMLGQGTEGALTHARAFQTLH
jgi:hypothetical protein